MAPNREFVRVQINYLDSRTSYREYVSTGQPNKTFGELVFLDDAIPSIGTRICRLAIRVKTSLRRLFQWRRTNEHDRAHP